jgi:hypothetical protein
VNAQIFKPFGGKTSGQPVSDTGTKVSDFFDSFSDSRCGFFNAVDEAGTDAFRVAPERQPARVSEVEWTLGGEAVRFPRDCLRRVRC